ncbi:MAG: radical SAM protein, partial [Candidatus Eremiobacterota bacterium]
RGQPDPVDGALCLACILPSGYTRTLLPAYGKEPTAPDLPLFGYAAVAFRGERLYCAAVRTEQNPRWDPRQYHRSDLAARLERRLKASPENRVLRQLAVCATEYGCYNAQNVFYGRWEGAVPVSPACNAVCRGCISLQPDDLPPSPQQRFDFVPTLEEIVEVGLAHLVHPEAIYSFGQGCEGEPLLRADLIARSIRAMRAETDRGCLHLNTNASRPAGLRAVVAAGLDSIRISLNSVLPRIYTAYYQPRNYTFEDVAECARISREGGLQLCLNYLQMPGWNDVEEEVDALLDFLDEHQVDQVQMRNLNIDPDLYAGWVERPGGRTLGIPELIRRIRTHCPRVRIGNHTAFFQRSR